MYVPSTIKYVYEQEKKDLINKLKNGYLSTNSRTKLRKTFS